MSYLTGTNLVSFWNQRCNLATGNIYIPLYFHYDSSNSSSDFYFFLQFFLNNNNSSAAQFSLRIKNTTQTTIYNITQGSVTVAAYSMIKYIIKFQVGFNNNVVNFWLPVFKILN